MAPRGGAPRGGESREEGAGGARVPEKKKKAEVFLLISRQPRRVSGRARDFQRARQPGLSGGGAWNPLPVPGESRALAFPRFCWGPALQPYPSQVVVGVPSGCATLDSGFFGPLHPYLMGMQCRPPWVAGSVKKKRGGMQVSA